MHSQPGIRSQGVWMAEEFLNGYSANRTAVSVIDFTLIHKIVSGIMASRCLLVLLASVL